ncbi:4Fe-4S single cluster domain-containing protein [Actinomadura sp. 9N215]|uniref:4Fe-4S single cluster domain-containing protein n=1 Tax=Actinomadura sp. 9N215 TaxID=3375150 RepID=UPI0037A04548
MTGLLLNRVHYPVTTLGPGRRAGIWVQGCTIGCDGCVARDTWDGGSASPVEVAEVLEWLASVRDGMTGVTVSGGEPFQQPEALAELLRGIRARRAGPPIDVLVYSGYPMSRLRRDAAARRVLELCDAVIAGPYLARRPTDRPWLGSANQRLVPLTPLGEERYAAPPPDAPRMQVVQNGNRVWFVGVPRDGEMERMADRLNELGITFDEATWRA